MAETKLYVIDTVKQIPCLENICGPITEPVKLGREDVIDLVKRGYTVYQVNPNDKTEKVLVTRSNINKIQFKNTRAAATTKRMLNRQIQDMNSPIIVPVHKNETKATTPVVEPEKTDKKDESNNSSVDSNKNKNKQNNNSTDNTSKVTKPDDFSK